eukprot:4584614-Alexandrium_andersonii.AAC.1
MVRRIVNGFCKDLRQAWGWPAAASVLSLLAPTLLEEPSAGGSSSSAAAPTAEKRRRALELVRRLHRVGGHASKATLRALLQRRQCPQWIQDLVGEIKCPDCAETSMPVGVSKVSLGAPPRIWQVVKTDFF